MEKSVMRILWALFIPLLWIVPARGVVVTCVNEGGGVVRLDYSATDETILPLAFALDLTVDGGATMQSIYDFKVGDSTAASPGYGIFPSSLRLDAQGEVSDWGTPDMSVPNSPNVQAGLGTSGVTLGLATRFDGPENAPRVTGTLCRIRVDTHGAPTVNVRVAPNVFGGSVIRTDGAIARFTGNGCTLGATLLAPLPPAAITYPATSSTGSYIVSWPASTGATSYQLERSANSGRRWTSIYSGAAVSYAETITKGRYRYRVRAANSAGSSDWRTGTDDCVVSQAPRHAR
jgi:hypothetical protein